MLTPRLHPEIIHHLGYPVQTYRVVNKDGYILTLFHMPNDGSRNPHAKKHAVYLQHGLVATCNNFLALQKDSLGRWNNNEGLGFFSFCALGRRLRCVARKLTRYLSIRRTRECDHSRSEILGN
ncbi:hypothetical protein HUJ04_011670 [Dendroctonus ponderosae]|nr:hypothetical protein HUJ04_011670 [Dendroctonus ponderosae]